MSEADKAVWLEQCVLMSMLIDDDNARALVAIMSAGDFQRDTHSWIFAVIRDAVEAKIRVDIVVVCEALKAQGTLEAIGGADYLEAMLDASPEAINPIFYAGLVKRNTAARQSIGGGLKN